MIFRDKSVTLVWQVLPKAFKFQNNDIFIGIYQIKIS